jgi:hypothetical protein
MYLHLDVFTQLPKDEPAGPKHVVAYVATHAVSLFCKTRVRCAFLCVIKLEHFVTWSISSPFYLQISSCVSETPVFCNLSFNSFPTFRKDLSLCSSSLQRPRIFINVLHPGRSTILLLVKMTFHPTPHPHPAPCPCRYFVWTC